MDGRAARQAQSCSFFARFSTQLDLMPMKSPCQADLSIFFYFIDEFKECVDNSYMLTKRNFVNMSKKK